MTEEHPNMFLFKQRNRRNLGEASDLFSADFVWRIVGGQIAEVWEIPAAHTARPQTRPKARVERPKDGG
jgi:hypothetical protein